MTGPYENYKNDDEASEKHKNKDKTKSKSKEKKQSAEDLALNSPNSPIPGQEKKAVVMDETQKENQHQNQNHNNVEPEAWYKHVKNSQNLHK